MLTWSPMPAAAHFRLCSRVLAWVGVFARSTMSSALSASIIVCAGYLSLLSFFRLKPIISCYSPTNVSEETYLIAFYNELSSLVHSTLKHNVLVIGGDMNAQIGKNIIYKFSLHNSSNGNGEYLTDFTLENRLTCLNTKFLKRGGKLWTYTYTNNNKAQIDYVFINKKWNNSALNCKAYSSTVSVSSDNRIVTAKIQLSLRKNMAQTTTTVHYDLSLLDNRDIRDKYTLTLRNKFNALQEKTETHTLNDKYENFVNAH